MGQLVRRPDRNMAQVLKRPRAAPKPRVVLPVPQISEQEQAALEMSEIRDHLPNLDAFDDAVFGESPKDVEPVLLAPDEKNTTAGTPSA